MRESCALSLRKRQLRLLCMAALFTLLFGCGKQPEVERIVEPPPPPLDSDQDGIPDEQDLCPQIYDPNQADADADGIGDPCDGDVDGDGVPNGADNCPTLFQQTQHDSDGDNLGDDCDLDLDGDGVPNEVDLCPLLFEYEQADVDGDGIGDDCDNDDDQDGIIDVQDNCPSVANPEQRDDDGDRVGDDCDPVVSVCGDGKVEEYEECDKGSASWRCEKAGMDGGKVRCNKDCRWDWSECVHRPQETDFYYQRGRGSCPYVFLWDGNDYHYYTDLSGSPIAAGLPFFRPEFYGSNVYELGGFSAVDGLYRMKLREVIFEGSYVDELALLVVDAPEEYEVLNAWSFTSQLGEHPSLDFFTLHQPRPPLSATDSQGREVLAEVSTRDGLPMAVNPSELSQVVLDFGPIEYPEHAKLVISAWSTYADLRELQQPPYSAGISIETMDVDGTWTLRKTAGKAAGDLRSWVIDISGLLSASDTRIRLTLAHQPTVLDVLDAVQLDDSPPQPFTVHRLAPHRAELGYGGSTRVDPSSLSRRIRASDEQLPLNPVALLEGNFTRYGDISPLLEEADDRFVIMSHGDVLELDFVAPPVTPNTTRRVFLEADVWYTLKYHPLGKCTESIEPLPFHGMTSYPAPDSPWREDPDYASYRDNWNTRQVRF